MKLRKYLASGALLILFSLPLLSQAQEIPRPAQIRLEDFNTRTAGSETLNGHRNLIIRAQARSQRVAKRLGYSRFVAWFDTVDNATRKMILFDGANNKLLTVQFSQFRRINGVSRAAQMEVRDHRKQKTYRYQLNHGKALLVVM